MLHGDNQFRRKVWRVLAAACICLVFSPALLQAAEDDITQAGDPVVGIPNNGNWPWNESPPNAIDDDVNTKYLHFDGKQGPAGFCVTPSRSESPVVGLRLTTANDAPERDPAAFELYGSNASINGPYTLIASGEILDFKQQTPWPRFTPNATPIEFSNATPYLHYQVLFTAVRNPAAANSMQIAEVELISMPEGSWPPKVNAGADQVVVLPFNQAQLAGQVVLRSDEPLILEWTVLSFPEGVSDGDVVFSPSRFAADPVVYFPATSGVYVFSLTASTEHHSVSDTLRMYVAKSLCPRGDLNADCRVDIEDLTVLAGCWLQTDSPLVSVPDVDGRNDGVNLRDFALLAEGWYRTGPQAVISEFLAVNRAKFPLADNEIADEDGDSSDWIELCNPTGQTINLEGWYLTDKPDNLTRWQIPSLELGPQAFSVIFASGKNRRTFGEPYHTNFSISSSPDYLALVAPDGQTVVHEFAYPAQYGGISYGLAAPEGRPSGTVELVPAGAEAYAKVPTDGSFGQSWTALEFEPVDWLTGTTGVGYERQTGYESLIGLDVAADLYGKNTSVYIRVPFVTDDLVGLEELTLWMMYDDGFVAYLNGVFAASANAPPVVSWNSQALGSQDADQYHAFSVSPEAVESLRKGVNVLAIHGLNRGTHSSDLLILPRLTAQREQAVAVTSLMEAYFQEPTPGARNTVGQMTLGPIIRDVTRNPVTPTENEDLVITANVDATGTPVEQVEMIYRIGFGEEIAVSMSDDGQGADAAAGDAVYTAVIPASAYQAGQMVRWYVRAADAQGMATRNPAFLLPNNSPEYFGTVVRDPSVQPPLQTLYYFVRDTAAEGTETGTRCSVFYMDEFYDNVFIRLRGGFYAASTGSRKIDFNDGEKFLFHPRFDRVDEINLNGQGADITFIRPPLSFETYTEAGVPSSIAFPLRVIRNNSEPMVRLLVEQPDRHMLRRVGLDDTGAYYKMYTDLNADLSGEQSPPVRKITRLDEDDSDLRAFAAGIAPDNPERGVFLFDHVNLPAVISYLAASVLIHENDHTHKNYFFYQDTNNTGEWMFIPWDKDLTFGLNNGIEGIIADQDWPNDPVRSPSHPFFGSKNHQKNDYQWNRLFDAVFSDPVSRQMYLRRLRTLMDRLLQSPGTPIEQLRYERRIDELAAWVAQELDSPAFWDAVGAIKTQYLPVRQTHLYINHAEGSSWPDDPAGIPPAQPEQFSITIGAIETNLDSGNREEDYIEICNPNAFAADISGWILDGGGVSHTFAGGTVIPAGGTLYVTPNAIAFRNRIRSPRGGEHRFVQGNYTGRLSRWGGTLTLYDTQLRTVASKPLQANPSNAQRYLRITELMYNPSPVEATDFETQDYEYVELLNTGDEPLPLGGVVFTEGIYYTFPDGVSLSPGGYVILAKDPAAFSARFMVPEGVTVVGGYDGQLSNSGEELILEDAEGNVIHRFEYDDDWYPLTDGQGFSLSKHDPAGSLLSDWNDKLGWRASSYREGSPGQGDLGWGIAPGGIVINEIMAYMPEQPDWIELHNTTSEAIPLGGWFLSDRNTDDNRRRCYQIPETVILPAGGYLVFYEDSTFGNSNAEGAIKTFGLSRYGETVYLFSGQNGQITGHYYAEQPFGVSRPGLSFGRYTYQDGQMCDFTVLNATTPGAANTNPAVGPLVIREVMYHPEPCGTYDKEEYEYIEIYNISNYSVLLSEYDAEQNAYYGWKLSDAVEFEFPLGVAIPSGGSVVVVRNIEAFTSRYPDVSSDIIFGPYDGRLNNAGETIDLLQPGADNDGQRSYMRIDRVAYSNGFNPVGQDPWPFQANGRGMALGRIDPAQYGNDPANWQAVSPSPGRTANE